MSQIVLLQSELHSLWLSLNLKIRWNTLIQRALLSLHITILQQLGPNRSSSSSPFLVSRSFSFQISDRAVLVIAPNSRMHYSKISARLFVSNLLNFLKISPLLASIPIKKSNFQVYSFLLFFCPLSHFSFQVVNETSRMSPGSENHYFIKTVLYYYKLPCYYIYIIIYNYIIIVVVTLLYIAIVINFFCNYIFHTTYL